MGTPWYDDKAALIEKTKGGLAGLNQIAEERRAAHYARNQDLHEFVFLGWYWGDSCGNFGKIQWTDGLPDAVSQHPEFSPVMTRNEWFKLMTETGIDMPMVSLMWELPPESMKCDQCHKGWTIADSHEAHVARITQHIPLDTYVGLSLAAVEFALQQTYEATVFLQPSLMVGNPAYEKLDKHPQYPEIQLRNGWGLDVQKNLYKVQPGDIGAFTVWYYRHPACQQKMLENEGKAFFGDAFQQAGYTGVTLTTIPSGYSNDPTVYQPWYVVKTNEGTLKVGWRKRVIHVEWMGDDDAPNIDFNILFADEDVTKEKTIIHAWSAEKVVEYLICIREAACPEFA